MRRFCLQRQSRRRRPRHLRRPKVEPGKPTTEEVAFAAKLVAFLDGCDELAPAVDKGAKPDQCSKQCDADQARKRQFRLRRKASPGQSVALNRARKSSLC